MIVLLAVVSFIVLIAIITPTHSVHKHFDEQRRRNDN